MESLQIRTGQVSVRILDDSGEERGIFKFNPQDVMAAQKFLELQDEIKQKQEDFNLRESECVTDAQKVSLLAETVAYFKELVDRCFGAGSSEVLFGNNNTLSMFNDFFEGIAPYYAKASKDRVAKYKKKK